MSSSIKWPCAARSWADLSARTTLKVGGRVEWLLEPARPEELCEAWTRALEEGFPVRVLGGGANLLVAEEELEGVVIATDRMRRVFRPTGDTAEVGDAGEVGDTGERKAPSAFEEELPRIRPPELDQDLILVAWCGAPMPGLVRTARDLGWSGLEGLAGVPGSLGGGVAMNAGGRWGDMWDVVESVRVLEADGTPKDLARADCEPRYRDGNLGGRVVLGAVLRLAQSQRELVRERVRDYLSQKAAAQPVTEASCGCVFKNPDPELSDGRSAGQLIDACGLLGSSAGGARVSEKHGNFIVNSGGARPADVLQLIEEVRTRVQEACGVRLETEVKIWRRGAGLSAPGGASLGETGQPRE